jgi:uncharacterized protein (TIGR02118 family)
MEHTFERRKFFTSAFVLAGGLTSTATTAQATPAGNAKTIFVLFRKPDMSRDQFSSEWGGERHVTIVRTVPGLTGWVQNRTAEGAPESAPDGIGELWFDSVEAMAVAMKSPQMGAAIEDAKAFLDMSRTYAIPVNEKAIM